MNAPEVLVLAMLVTCVLVTLSRRFEVPNSIIILLGGVLLGLMPFAGALAIAPENMLLVFLPPLLMEAAYFTSLRDFRKNLRPILQLAVGLVLITGVAVAFVFQLIVPGAGWAVGFVLGAIISPPDVVAATSVIKKMSVPKRISTILEGESLVNDAMGLVMYKFAVAAVVTSQFSLVEAGGQFLWMIISGVAVGLVVGFVFVRLFPRIQDLPIEILGTFVIPYLSYILAEEVHGSGVLAVVITGLYVGWHSPTLFTPRFRIPAEAVWRMVSFVLSALVFILIGLQIPALFERLSVYTPSFLLGSAAAICATVVVLRFIYVFMVAYGTRCIFSTIREHETNYAWQNVLLVAYVGMRGVVSLATALALPLSVMDGSAFPHRDLILFLALAVIVFTLVVQGLLLPFIVRRLTLSYDSNALYEDWFARISAARRAMEKLEDIEFSGTAHSPALMRIKSHYQERIESLGDGPNTPLVPTETPDSMNHPILQAENRIWHEVLQVEREVLIGLRKAYQIGDDVLHDITRELDLLETRFEHRA